MQDYISHLRASLIYETFSESNPEDPHTLEGRKYSLNCEGEVGDMLYLTDLDYASPAGHCIAEVEIYGDGE